MEYFDTGTLGTDPASIADSFELHILGTAEKYLSVSEYRDLFFAGDQPAAASIDAGLFQIERRKRTGGDAYPFVREAEGVAHLGSAWSTEYTFLLLVSQSATPFRSAAEYVQVDYLFDFIVKKALLARHTNALVFGAHCKESGRPTSFPEAVKWLATSLDIEHSDRLPVQKRDAGVDVVAWSPYRDGQQGHPVTLYQCTVRESFDKKPLDVQVELWRDWLRFRRPPQVGFAVPFSLSSQIDHWSELSSLADDILDRLRIMELLDLYPSHSPIEYSNELQDFVHQQWSGIRLNQTHPPAPYGARRKAVRAPK